MIDTARIGLVAAKALERLEQLQDQGRIEGDARVAAVYVLVALERDSTPEEREDALAWDVVTQFFAFGDPDSILVRDGLLHNVLHENRVEFDDD